MYMKRFGWSRPALLIGFVLSIRLDAAVYQSVQVYGMSFLGRGGVQIMLALIAVSVYLAVRFKPLREPLTADGPHAATGRAPQMIFLGMLTAFVGYAIYEMSRLSFLGRVFPLSVAAITFVLLVAAIALCSRGWPSYVLHDSEREWTAADRPQYSAWHFQCWMLGLLGAVAVVGFVLGVFIYLCAFLRIKARAGWIRTALGASGAIFVLSLLSHLLVFDYPRGVLQLLVELPWPLN
jgi:hypothetical protein